MPVCCSRWNAFHRKCNSINYEIVKKLVSFFNFSRPCVDENAKRPVGCDGEWGMAAARAEARRPEFEALYECYHREVWAVAFARRPDADGAMELMQESFLRLWRAWQLGEQIDSPRAWLFRVCRNLAEDEAKSSFRKNGTQSFEILGAIRGNGIAPDEQLIRGERFLQVRTVLAELTPPDREVLTLKYAFDRDSTDIAEILGINVAAVHMRLSRARQRLAERLTAAGVTES